MDAIQVFDSWAGTLSLADYRSYVLPHSSRVFAALAGAGVPMTHFGVGTAELLGAMSQARRRPGRRRGLAHLADRRRRAGATGHRAAGQPRPGRAAGGLCRWRSARCARSSRTAGARSTRARRATCSTSATACCPAPIRRCHHRGRGIGAFAVNASVCRCRRRDFGSGRRLPAAGRCSVPDATITVFDPADRLGGVLRTEQVGGQPMDVGAEAFVARRPEVPALLAELGLAGRQIGTTGVRPLIYSQAPAAPAAARHPQRHPDATASSLAGLVDDATIARMLDERDTPVVVAAGRRSRGRRAGR